MKTTTPGKRIVNSALNMTSLDFFAIWRAYRYDKSFSEKYPEFYKAIKNYGFQYIPRMLQEDFPTIKWRDIVKNAPRSKYLEVASHKRKETDREKMMRENYFVDRYYGGIHDPKRIKGADANDTKRWTEAWNAKGREYAISLILSDLRSKYKSLCKDAIKYAVAELKHDYGINAFYETMEEIYRGEHNYNLGSVSKTKRTSKVSKPKAKVKPKRK